MRPPSLAALLLAGLLAAPAAAASPGLDDAALWSPQPGELIGLRDACASKAGPEAGSCLLAFMERAGASDAAISFARAIGGTGYLGRFVNRGRVDLARVPAPLREGAADRFFLVNGTPPRLEVSDRALLAPLQSDPRVERLSRGEPPPSIQAELPASAGARPLPNGGQRFLFVFPVRTCPDCPTLASAFVSYDFDASGRFSGASLAGVRRPAVFSVSGSLTKGQTFEAPVGGGLTFRLEPFSEGWTIALRDKAGRDYCGVVTPPYAGDNDLVLHGRQFRGARAQTRKFRCLRTAAEYAQASASLGKVLWGEGASPRQLRDARRLHAVLTGAARPARLAVREVEVAGTEADAHPPIVSLKFKFDLFPAPGEKSGPDEASTEPR